MIKDLSIGISILLSLVAVWIAFRFIKRRAGKKKTEDHLIFQPKLYFWVGLLFAVITFAVTVFITLAVIFPVEFHLRDPENFTWLIYPAFGFLIVFGILMAMYGANWKVTICDDCFIYRNIFRIRRKYYFEDVTVKMKSARWDFFQGERKVLSISYLQDNCDALSDAIKTYKKSQKAREKKKQNR